MLAFHELTQVRMRLFNDRALVSEVGFDAGSEYVERFWLPVVGPTSLALIRWAARELDELMATDVDLGDLGATVGISKAVGPNTPLVRTLVRLQQFGAIQYLDNPSTVLFRKYLPILTRGRLVRLPIRLQVAHGEFLDRVDSTPHTREVAS